MKIPILVVAFVLLPLSSAKGEKLAVTSDKQKKCNESASQYPAINYLFDSWGIPRSNKSYCNWVGVECDADCSVTDLKPNFSVYDGPILERICEFPKLTRLDLSHHNFTGKIPWCLSQKNLLEVLALSNNKLAGMIPGGFGNLERLQLLDLSFNRFNELAISSPQPGENSGHVPAPALKVLLSNNNFTGSIPPEIFKEFSSAVSMNLSHNQFNGSLPDDVRLLTNLSQLDVSNNNLSGEFPLSIFNCSMLDSLYLGNNNFNGSIDKNFTSHLTKLQRLDLSHNNFSGEFPFDAFKNLQFLDLSNNSFDGKVPEVGLFCDENYFFVGGNPNINFTGCNRNATSEKNNTVNRSGSRKVVITIIVVICLTLFFLSFFVFFAKRGYVSDKSVLGRPFKDSVLFKAPLAVTYADLQTATKGFSAGNLIGSGYTGSVFKGILLKYQNKAVAVKVLNKQGTTPDFDRFTEVFKEMRSITHTNLVNVLTSCEDIDANGDRFMAWVHELMPKGNLEMWLHEEVVSQVLGFKKWNLSWYQRLNMAIDVAFALKHLHCKHQNPIVHCNLKPSNILIAEDMTALLVDFGMDRLFPLHTIIGKSRGYIAPECAIGNPSSPMWDVFSFGVILLEMFTGQRPTNEAFRDGLTLRKYVLQRFRLDLVEIIDPLLISEETGGRLTERALQCIRSIIQIALDCSSEKPEDRTEISQAHEKLQHVKLSFLEVGSDVLMPNGPFNRVESSVAMLV